MFKRSLLLTATVLTTLVSAFGQGQVVPSMGKEFWIGFLQNYEGAQDLRLYISGTNNTTGVCSMPLQGWSQNFTVTANVVTEIAIPLTAMHTGSEFVDNKSILVLTDDTVAVFALNFQTATADAAVIYPLQSLGVTYMAQCYLGLQSYTYQSEFLIVATKDDTEVEITPACNTTGGQTAGNPFTIQLDSAESYQVQAANSSLDLTGSTVVATAASGSCRPFAVFSGSVCPNIPVGCYACDHVFDENLPVNVWGRKYYTVPWSTTTSYTYRILALTNGTVVTVDGVAQPALNAGQYVEVNSATGARCFESTVPFSVAQFIQGNSCSGGSGDPAELILNAEEQKINDITFATVVSANMTAQFANVIVETASVGSVMLDGVNVPAASFTPFTACGTQSYAQLPLTQGSHRLVCPTGVTAYIYGLGPNYETYAYSAGSFTPIPPIVVDSVFCGLDTNGTLTLAPPTPINNPFWTVLSDPDDTLYFGSPYTFVPPGSDVYIVTGYEFQSECEQQFFFSVEVDDPPQTTVTASDVNVCAYETVQLGVTPNPGGTYLYNWWPDAEIDDGSLQNPVANPSQSTWFYVSVSTLNNCAVTVDSIYVNVMGGDVLIYEASTPDDAICLGDTTQLELDVQQIIAQDQVEVNLAMWWNDIQNGAIGNSCGSVTGDAIYFDGGNPRLISSIAFDVTAGGSIQFAVKLGSGVAPCDDLEPGEDIVLEYSTDFGGSWSLPFFTLWEYQYPSFTTVTVPIPAGAMTANTMFRWRQLNSSGAGQDNWSLDNIAISTVNQADLTFDWTPVGEISSPNMPMTDAWPSVTGWYYINSTDIITTCTYEDSVYITVGAPFTLTVTNDTTICDIAGIQLHATPDAGTNHVWLWTPGTDLSATFVEDPIATPSSTIEYHVSVTSAEGCERVDSVTITVGQLLDLTVNTSDDELCQGESANLTANVGGALNISFLWSPANTVADATDATTVASPNVSTWYVMTATDTQSGCILTDSVYIAVSTAYDVFAGNDTVVCTTNGFSLNVVHNVVNPDILWTPGNYLVNENTATPTVTFDSTATYIVTVTDDLGCLDRDTINVTVAFDQLSFIPDSSLCAGDSMLINAGYPDADHLWSTGETTQWIWVSTADDYVVTMTDDYGCQVTVTTTVTVDPLPVIDLGPDTSLCIGEQWTLDAENPGSVYLWNTNEVTQTITVSTNDLYDVQVTDGNTCVNTDEINVTFDPLPVINLNDTIVCVSEVITLDAGNPGSYYVWNTGAQTQTINVQVTSYTYSVTVTTPTVCVASDSAHVVFIPFPEVDLGPDMTLCDSDTLPLDAGNPGMSFLWSTMAQTQTYTLYDDATVWVDVFNGYCITRDSLVAVFNPLPVPMEPDSMILCMNKPPYKATLDAGNPGCTFLWSTDETTQVIESDIYGWYAVRITTPLNCTIMDSVHVIEFCGSELYVPNAFTPDGDGVNDRFFPTGLNIGQAELTIFDRWGEVVFTGQNGNASWDGTFGGTVAKDGVYVWKLKYRFVDDVHGTMGAEREAIGHVTMLR